MLTVSVVTLFHNRRDLAVSYLQQWRQTEPRDQPTELLLGDCLSTDGTAELVGGFELGRPTCFSSNLGFACGNNELAKQASGDLLVFLNNDVQLIPGWLENLTQLFDGRPNLGILGNIQLSVRTSEPDHAGIFFDPEGAPFHFRPTFSSLADLPPLLPVPVVTGACLAIRRDLFAALGGFDTAYRNGYEDIDLCLRARENGAEIAIATRSIIWHYISASPGRQKEEDANAQRFFERWSEAARKLNRFQPPSFPAQPPATETAHPIFQAHETLQVFFPGEDGHQETHASFHLYPLSRWTRITVPLPKGSRWDSRQLLRLDPSRSRRFITLGGLALRRARGQRTLVWQAPGKKLSSFCTLAGTTKRLPETRALAFESTGEDPQILVALPRETIKSEEALVLEVWLKTTLLEEETGSTTFEKKRRWEMLRGLLPSKVLVDLWRLQPGGGNGGIKVFSLALLHYLARNHRWKLQFTLVVNSALEEELQETLKPCRLIALDAAEYEGGELGTGETPDLLYAPLGYSRFSRQTLPQVSLIVDLLHRDLPEMLPPEEVAFRERWLVETLARSAVLQCNSKFVAERLIHHYHIDPARTVVVYNAIQNRLNGTEKKERKSGSATPYFFYPANDWPHKNHPRLLEAYAKYRAASSRPWDLRLTGFIERRSELEKLIRERGLEGSVKIHGHLELEAYADLFRASGALIFPSLYEGLGIPVLEAMELGVPVACSRTASLPEVGDKACLYFDPLDSDAIAAALTRMSTDAALREKLVQMGKERSRAFSPKTEFDRLARVLRAVARGRSVR